MSGTAQNARFGRKAVANILSLGVITDKYRVTMDSAKDNAFYVHTENKVVRFGRDESMVYTHILTTLGRNKTKEWTMNHQITTGMFVQTVEENKLFYTPREVARAKKARDLLIATGSPSVADLKNRHSYQCYSKQPSPNRRRQSRREYFWQGRGDPERQDSQVEAATKSGQHYCYPSRDWQDQRLMGAIYRHYVCKGIPYLTTISGALYYRTAIPMKDQKAPELYATIDKVFRIYNGRDFIISDIHADNQFKPLLEDLQDELECVIHFCPAGGHVPQGERNNRFLKERIRATYHQLPFKALPIKLMKALVMESARKSNYFPNKHGISKYFSPRQLLLRESLDYERHCKYHFGQYVQAHNDETNPRNSQQGRTLDALYIRSVTSGHEVYNLATDEIITRVKVTPLPISATCDRYRQQDCRKTEPTRLKSTSTQRRRPL